MYLIVGLGNPGKEYELNRHNAGFTILDSILEKYNFIQDKNKYNSLVYKAKIDNNSVIAIKPQSFMNESGKPVSAFVNFYKIPVKQVIVIYDEITLEFTKVRVSISGSDAGHNGIKSINSLIANKYIKIRIGVGHPGNKSLVSKHVLNDFLKEEQRDLNELGKKIAELFDHVVGGELNLFSSYINQKD